MQSITLAFENIQRHLESLGSTHIDEFNQSDTLFIITDMINGFAHEGALSSPRVKALCNPIANLAQAFEAKEIPIIAFADTHPENSPEFTSYPPHCLGGTEESDIVPEIKNALKTLKRIDKNSTNGYQEPEFQTLLAQNPQWTNFVVVGDCTDICIQQFAVTLKTHFNRLNQTVRVIVPADKVQTYDYDLHHGDLLHTMGLYMMVQNGVEVVKTIDTSPR